MRVNKAELAQILGISLPTIAAYMMRYGDAFPVLEKGGRGRDYWFEHEAVIAFLDARKAEEDALDAERQAALRQAALPLGHNGGPAIEAELPVRPADMLALMKVRRMQREEAYACGLLVEARKVRERLEELLGTWNRELRRTLRQFGRDRDLPDQLVADLDAALADCQRRVVSYARGLGEPAQKSMFQGTGD